MEGAAKAVGPGHRPERAEHMTDIQDRIAELRAERHSFIGALRVISRETTIDVGTLERVVKRAEQDDRQDAKIRARGETPGWEAWIQREGLEAWPPRPSSRPEGTSSTSSSSPRPEHKLQTKRRKPTRGARRSTAMAEAFARAEAEREVVTVADFSRDVTKPRSRVEATPPPSPEVRTDCRFCGGPLAENQTAYCSRSHRAQFQRVAKAKASRRGKVSA